ncbi:MAG TPA: zinc ABC transporter substrate-binding protein ZnuA [Pasteurellaceae bacterium]|nr:zinc ABC transporter substrate-binding protein ZnuA [Pasteurellaceae bacterium]
MSFQIFKKTVLASVIGAFSCVVQANILASVKPLGLIASSIADGVTETEIIVPPGASPHDYSLKPSDVKKVKSADVVLWIGEDVDGFLAKNIGSIDSSKVIEIAQLPEIKLRLGKSEHHHEHGDEKHADHNHGHDHRSHDKDKHDKLSINWHVWYSPEISKVVARKLADKLSEQYPDKKALVAQNLENFNRTLAQQSEKISTQLAPFANKGFYVFHDAYGYFNDAYGLKQTGYFTINPLVAPGAQTLATIKEEIKEHKVSCLFAEPQFTPRVIESLSKGTGVHIGHLDPMGDKVALGKNAYADFLQFTADSYAECLNK